MSYIKPRLNVTKVLSYKIISIKKKEFIYSYLFDFCEDGFDCKYYTDDASIQIQDKGHLSYIPKLLENPTFRPKSIILENTGVQDTDLENKYFLALIARRPEVLNLNLNSIGNEGCVILAKLIEEGLFKSLYIAAQHRSDLSMDGLLTIRDAIAMAFQEGTLQEYFVLEIDLFLKIDSDDFLDALKFEIPENIEIDWKSAGSCFLIFKKK